MKYFKYVFIGVFFVFLYLAAQQLWKPQDKRIDTGDVPGKHESWDPQIAALNDDVYVVWHDNRDGDSGVYFNLSTDQGNTWWDRSLRLSTKPGPHALDEVLAPQIRSIQNNIYVVWEQRIPSKDQKNIYFNYSQDKGWNWQAEEIRLDRCDQNGKLSCRPQIACAGQNVYAAWIDNRNSNWDIFFNYSSDMGTSWQAEDVRLNSEEAAETRNYTYKDITARNNNVYVVCEKNKPNKRGEIYFYYSHDGGNSWKGRPKFLARGYQPKVCCREKYVYIVWHDKNEEGNYDVFFNASSDRGETWMSHPVKLNFDKEDVIYAAYSPQIACSKSNVYVTWVHNAPLLNDIYFSSSFDYGKTWQSLILPSSTFGNFSVWNPQISCTGENVSVVWENKKDGITGGTAIYCNFSTDSGMQWQLSPIRLDIGQNIYPNESVKPQIACLNDYVYVVWEDMRNGFYDGHWGGWLGGDIYFNSVDLSKPYYTLVTNSGKGGSIEPGPGSYMCPPGSIVNIEAFPEEKFEFSYWSGAVQGTENPIQVTMDSRKKVFAHFDHITYNLSIKKDGAGSTNPVPGKHPIIIGTEVKVKAIPKINHVFTGWTGDVVSQENPITITMDSDTAIQANFKRQFKLTIEYSKYGSTFPLPGVHFYIKDTVVVITAIPSYFRNIPHIFKDWRGDLSGSMNPASIIMDSDKTVKAHFLRRIYMPYNFYGILFENRSLFYIVYTHMLKWEANPYNENVVKYRLYLMDGTGLKLLSEIPAGQFKFINWGIDKNKTYTYLLKAVIASGREGDPSVYTIK